MTDLFEPRNFYRFFRAEFGYLEADENDEMHNLMSYFYEHTYSKSYPWMRVCGFWNVFVVFDLNWDSYDHLFSFMLTLNPETNGSAPMMPRERYFLDDVLAVFDKQWVPPWIKMGTSDGPELVKIYAAAIKPFAKEIFIPDIRPSVGFEGFKWHSAAKKLNEQRDQLRLQGKV